MNWTALRKTLTPSLQGSGLILLLLLFLVLFMSATAAIVVGAGYLLTYLFGKDVGYVIWIGFILSPLGYIMIVYPLIDRYRRIKRNLERENNG